MKELMMRHALVAPAPGPEAREGEEP